MNAHQDENNRERIKKVDNKKQDEIDALCPECGHAFKTYIDRIMHVDDTKTQKQSPECPVCGCGDCKIGK